MKTIIATRIVDGGVRVAIIHRLASAGEGGIVAAWLMQNGCFLMPKSETESNKIALFKSPIQAERAAEKAFSVLKFCAEMHTPC